MSEVDVIICSYFIGGLYSFSCIDFPISFCLHIRHDKERLLTTALNFRTKISKNIPNNFSYNQIMYFQVYACLLVWM